MDLIFRRRSIRKYTSQEITDVYIEKILRAAMAAPSAHNGQPWQFVVIKDKNILNSITTFHPYSKMLLEASCAIVVCGDLSDEEKEKRWVQDCSAATENMLLMATELGLGSVWLGVYPDEDRVNPLKELLGIPEHVIPLSIVSLGYPAETKKIKDKFDKSKVHFNKWQDGYYD